SGVFALSERLKWPILPDILSQGRCVGSRQTLIPFYDSLLKVDAELQAECILHIGDRLVSRVLQEWLKSHRGVPYLQLTTHAERHDPSHQVTYQITSPIDSFCQELLPTYSLADGNWLLAWKEGSSAIRSRLEEFFSTGPYTGSRFFFELEHHLPPEHSLFIGN